MSRHSDHADLSYSTTNAADLVGINVRRSSSCVDDGSARPTLRWTSWSLVPFSRAVV
jgi:hypothetical protein